MPCNPLGPLKCGDRICGAALCRAGGKAVYFLLWWECGIGGGLCGACHWPARFGGGPETTPQRAIDLLEQEKADVIVHGSSWIEANALAQSKRTDTDAFFHPFDDPLLWEGHASMIDEVVADGLRPDAVILSVGGGGLLAGVHHGLIRNGLTTTPIFALETHGMASYHAALNAGASDPGCRQRRGHILGAKQVCQQAYDISQTHDIRSVLVSDKEAVDACFSFLSDHRILVEPACGAAWLRFMRVKLT